jgi:4-hydroxy-tetrahydrodipicolinate synthase
MTADLAVDLHRVVAHNRWLLENGCDGVAPLGTTGEANSLSVDERLAILDTLADAGITGAQIIAGVGCCAFPDTVTLTKRALDNGAGGVLMLPPFYYKAPSENGLFAAYANIVEQVGDPALQIYLYNFPQQVGFELPISLVARLHEAFPDTIVGMKDSSGDWPRMKRIYVELPTFRLMPGSEEFLVPALRLGAAGCISATVNVNAPYAGETYRHWQDDDADERQAHLTQLRQAFNGMQVIPAMKAYFAQTWDDNSWTHVRPPFQVANPKDLATASERLAAADFTLAA